MKILIFGMNDRSKVLLCDQSYNVVSFVSNDLYKCNETYNGYKVINLDDICNEIYDALVIALPYEEKLEKYYVYETLLQLKMVGVNKNKIYLLSVESDENYKLVDSLNIQQYINVFSIDKYREIFSETHPKSIILSHLPYVVERSKNRRVYIYGTGYNAMCFSNMLKILGIVVEKYISDDSKYSSIDGKEVISTIDLVYDTIGEYFIFVADDKESYGITRIKLSDLGLLEDFDFTYHSEIPGTEEPFYYDVTLSYSRIRGQIEGFEIFGNTYDSNAIKIVALGGSTTESSLFYVRGWVQFLADILKEKNISAVLYCGGVSGYTSTQELLKFERDVIPLEPDIVISYSGVNDIYMFPSVQDEIRYKKPFITEFQVQFINQILEKLIKLQYGLPRQDVPYWEKGGKNTVFYGIPNDKTSSQFWIDNTRMMHALSQEFGIAFFSFFQPYRFNGYYKSNPIQDIIHSRRDPSCNPSTKGETLYCRDKELQETRKLIQNYDYITDLSEIFAEEVNIYYDSVHVYEKGNQIIAKKIADIIIDYLQISEREKNNV